METKRTSFRDRRDGIDAAALALCVDVAGWGSGLLQTLGAHQERVLQIVDGLRRRRQDGLNGSGATPGARDMAKTILGARNS